MFGKVRCSSLESLESQRFSSKLQKEDSLSIYEVTLVKLKLGSQRSKDLEFTDHDSPVSSLTSVDRSMKIETSSSCVTTSQEDRPDFGTPLDDEVMMSIDTDSDSPSSRCDRDQRPGSIAYMFSKFKNAHQQSGDSSSYSGIDSMETGFSSSSSSPSFVSASPSFEHRRSEQGQSQ